VKLEVGKKYRISESDKPWEVVAIDGCGVAWGLVDGVMRHLFVNVISEWHDKPDPGEGWRLLHPDEDVEEGDEYRKGMASPDSNWIKVDIDARKSKKQIPSVVYRRRTTPQYVPYAWEDRNELRGRWYRNKETKLEAMVYYFSPLGSDFRINSYCPEMFLELCEWLDGSPCGKKVV
jgi:hypothetical protein